MSLTAETFPAFFREMNAGNDPFPWQQRLAREVFHNGWPNVLDLPTASGKTAVLDIAVFHLALEAGFAHRRAPMRIAFVVDRRLIVDQAHERARRIQRLLEANEGVAQEVAAALRSISGGEPLSVHALRGGLPRESDWARTPVQPSILLSTVDQVGSRLLFRGYGVSKSMRPVHAGLLGSDCLMFLDEAHLSEPFRQSLDGVRRYRGGSAGPWGLVTLSATPTSDETQAFRLEQADREHPALGPRIKAPKMTELREVSADDLGGAYAAAAIQLQALEGVQQVLIVVNRVDLARAIFDLLNKEQNAILLTGRIRDVDRDKVVDRLLRQCQSGEKFIAVATQCIEAGVDLDFDGLVTQIAPIDALRQRFGRLNRTGRPIEARAIVLATREEISRKPDPIYGEMLKKTWDVLKEAAVSEKKMWMLDFGALALAEKLGPAKLQECATERMSAPFMPPAYVDLWSCTNPPPAVEPEVALFLHGPERASADVEIVWRADLTKENLPNFSDFLELAPPRAGETLSVPVWKVRAWLSGQQAADIGDFEGGIEPVSGKSMGGLSALKWEGGDAARVWPDQIRPGDVIVVPAAYGGCDEWGWTSAGVKASQDRGFEAAARERRADIGIRFHPSLFSKEIWADILSLIGAHQNDSRDLFTALKNLEGVPFHDEVNAIRSRTVAITFYNDDDPGAGFILTGRRSGKSEASTEDDRTANFGEAVSLAHHTNDVIAKTDQFSAGLPDVVRRALRLAAKLHDFGKSDGRFQSWLDDGENTGRILAKSGRYSQKPPSLPAGWRHEALSVRIAIRRADFCAEPTEVQELALWLIGTHHGWGRPFFPHDDEMDDRAREIVSIDGEKISLDASPGPQRLSFDWNGLDWASLFERLHVRYGAWELAFYEAVLRLADHRASEEEEINAERTSALGAGA